MTSLNLSHVPAILDHMSNSSVFQVVLNIKDQGVVLYRLTAENDSIVLIEGFKVSYEPDAKQLDAFTERCNSIVWVGRKSDIFADYHNTEEGHDNFDVVTKNFRDCIFPEFGLGERVSSTRLNIDQLLKS